MREQLFTSCSSNLVALLKERKYDSVEDMIDDAERYQVAHPGQNLSAKGNTDVWTTNVAVGQGGDQGGNWSGGFRGRGGGTRGSFRNRFGWFGGRGQGSHNQMKGQMQPNKKGTCWNCGCVGHYSRRCPKPVRKPGGGEMVNVAIPLSRCAVCKEQYSVTKPCGRTFESAGVVFAGSSTSTGLLKVCAGSVNGREVEMMLDSGSATVGV